MCKGPSLQLVAWCLHCLLGVNSSEVLADNAVLGYKTHLHAKLLLMMQPAADRPASEVLHLTAAGEAGQFHG